MSEQNSNCDLKWSPFLHEQSQIFESLAQSQVGILASNFDDIWLSRPQTYISVPPVATINNDLKGAWHHISFCHIGRFVEIRTKIDLHSISTWHNFYTSSSSFGYVLVHVQCTSIHSHRKQKHSNSPTALYYLFALSSLACEYTIQCPYFMRSVCAVPPLFDPKKGKCVMLNEPPSCKILQRLE